MWGESQNLRVDGWIVRCVFEALGAYSQADELMQSAVAEDISTRLIITVQTHARIGYLYHHSTLE
jgi:hypothetical protein